MVPHPLWGLIIGVVPYPVGYGQGWYLISYGIMKGVVPYLLWNYEWGWYLIWYGIMNGDSTLSCKGIWKGVVLDPVGSFMNKSVVSNMVGIMNGVGVAPFQVGVLPRVQNVSST